MPASNESFVVVNESFVLFFRIGVPGVLAVSLLEVLQSSMETMPRLSAKRISSA